MPSASRHYWGTDVDLNNINSSYWDQTNGKKEFAWLSVNAATFGFCQVYSSDRQTGYNEEKWHWSYMPLAKTFASNYKQIITNQVIARTGFKGADTAVELNFIEDYVLGINPKCQ